MGIAVSSLIAVIGFLGIFDLNSDYANISVLPVIASEWVYLFLLLADLPKLFLLLWLQKHPQAAELEIRICFANLAVMPSCLVLPCTVPRRGAATFLNWS